MQTKFHVPRSHSFREKCDDNLKLASHFSPILCHRGTWNIVYILTHMDTLCKPNFMFFVHTVFEKNAMITCKNSKSHIRPNKQLWNFRSYHRIFLRYCATEELEIFFCILTNMNTLCKPNFMFLGRTVFDEKCDDNLQKFKVTQFALINNFEILQVDIAFFSNTVRPRNLKFILYFNPYGYSMQTKFHVPRSHSFWENDNLKFASHFSPILCDRGTWNFFCILTHMDTVCKPNLMFLGQTVFEKNAMITCKNSKLHIRPNKQLWNFTS